MQIIESDSIANGFQAAVDLIATWAVDDPPLCWFRGVKDASLDLRPGAYWRVGYNEFEPLLMFAQEGVAFTHVGSLDEWDTYYLAQHHRIPTRLLDWTESFSAALFFAFDGWDGATTPCIWILQPGPLNGVFLSWDGIVAPENNPETDSWLPKKIAMANPIQQDADGLSYDNRWPLAIYPKKTNTRMNAQQGAFTVHGHHSGAIDSLVTQAGGDPQDVLARIDLKGFDKDDVVSHLGLLGIRRSAVYPDVDNFVRQVKEYYKW